MSVVLELIAQLRELQADDFFGDWARELADHLEWRISEPQHDAFDLPDSGDPERDRSALADWLQRAADAPPFLAPSWTRNFSEGVAWLVRHERTVTHQALMAAASQTRQWSVPPEWSDPPPELLTPRSMTTVETPQADLSGAALSVMVLFAACVGIALRLAWNPPIKTYVEYLPIGAVFAGLIWDRLFPVSSAPCTALCDAAVVILAGMRAIVPPLPFVSGHTLLSAYAMITARHAPLRIVALTVLAQVVYDKLFVTGGAASMAAGAIAAIGIAAFRRRC